MGIWGILKKGKLKTLLLQRFLALREAGLEPLLPMNV